MICENLTLSDYTVITKAESRIDPSKRIVAKVEVHCPNCKKLHNCPNHGSSFHCDCGLVGTVYGNSIHCQLTTSEGNKQT